MRLAFDIDGVFADFNSSYIELFIEKIGVCLFPETWKELLDVSYPAIWDYEKEAGYTKEEIKQVWSHIKESPKFWLSLGYYDNIKESVRLINKIAKTNEVYFISNRSGNTAKQQTEKWLYDLGLNYPTVMLAANKLPIINSLGIEAFIDDRPETIEEVAQGSIARIYIKDTPYNRHVAEDHRITRVDSVMAMLTKEGLV